jgi:hypothetical protein
MSRDKAELMRESRKRKRDAGLVSYRRDVKPEHVPKLDKLLAKLNGANC